MGRNKDYWVPGNRKNFCQEKMPYKLIARDRIFCEGTEAECQSCLTNISMMMDIFSTDYDLEEFLIVSTCDEV